MDGPGPHHRGGQLMSAPWTSDEIAHWRLIGVTSDANGATTNGASLAIIWAIGLVS
jgi:hypothetical protein